jgi:hypothetical protein
VLIRTQTCFSNRGDSSALLSLEATATLDSELDVDEVAD